jgi:hypothetical protein
MELEQSFYILQKEGQIRPRLSTSWQQGYKWGQLTETSHQFINNVTNLQL